jgi:hypothetical protein
VKAGGRAKARLALAGIQVLEKAGFIEELLDGYINYLRRPVPGGGGRGAAIGGHPCFSEKAHNKSGRVHLPVSPACNIQCRFCARARNTGENRPGVAAGVLIRDSIRDQEEKYGKIDGKVTPSVSVKPPRKS